MPFPYESWDRSIIVKREGSGALGIRPEDRPTALLIKYGVINLDKPSGPTSHMATAYVKEILELERCGHSGTLDPKVTGVLPIALGYGSRIVQALLPAGKEYVGLMHLHRDVPEEQLLKVLKEFTGVIKQMPPVKSAVKRVVRKRVVYYLDVLERNAQDVLFRVGCQAGTYIRKLCFDIGERLGVGAHMAELRRTRVANFDESTAVTLHDIKDAYAYYKEGNDKPLRKIILPVESAVEHLPKLWVLDSAVESISHGRDVALPGVSKFEMCNNGGRLTAVMSLKNELVALGECQMEPKTIQEAKKGIVVKVHKVFIGHARALNESFTKV